MVDCWSEAEQSKLEQILEELSSLELTPKERFAKVAQHVGTKSARECATRFLYCRQKLSEPTGPSASSQPSEDEDVILARALKEEAERRKQQMQKEVAKNKQKLAEKELAAKNAADARQQRIAQEQERRRREEADRVARLEREAEQQRMAMQRAQREARQAAARQANWTVKAKAAKREAAQNVRDGRMASGAAAALAAIAAAKPAEPSAQALALAANMGRGGSKKGKKKKQQGGSSATASAAASQSSRAPSQEPQQTEEEEADEEEEAVCMICCQVPEFWMVPSCDHVLCCSECAFTLRFSLDDKKCMQCRTHLDEEEIIISRKVDVPFVEFGTMGKISTMPGVFYDPDLGAFFDDKDHCALIKRINSPDCCPEADCNWSRGTGAKSSKNAEPIDALRRHLLDSHSKKFCDICLDHRKVLLHRQKTYTQPELERHMKGLLPSDKESNFKGHPICCFCDIRFYDGKLLGEHLRKKHFWCHLCQKAGRTDIYFEDYNCLREHFILEHYFCEICDEYAVFDDVAGLREHRKKEHPNAPCTDKDLLGFRVGHKNFEITHSGHQHDSSCSHPRRQGVSTIVSYRDASQPQRRPETFTREEFPTVASASGSRPSSSAAASSSAPPLHSAYAKRAPPPKQSREQAFPALTKAAPKPAPPAPKVSPLGEKQKFGKVSYQPKSWAVPKAEPKAKPKPKAANKKKKGNFWE